MPRRKQAQPAQLPLAEAPQRSYRAEVWRGLGGWLIEEIAEPVVADTPTFAADLVWLTMTVDKQAPRMTVTDIVVLTDTETGEEHALECDFRGWNPTRRPN